MCKSLSKCPSESGRAWRSRFAVASMRGDPKLKLPVLDREDGVASCKAHDGVFLFQHSQHVSMRTQSSWVFMWSHCHSRRGRACAGGNDVLI